MRPTSASWRRQHETNCAIAHKKKKKQRSGSNIHWSADFFSPQAGVSSRKIFSSCVIKRIIFFSFTVFFAISYDSCCGVTCKRGVSVWRSDEDVRCEKQIVTLSVVFDLEAVNWELLPNNCLMQIDDKGFFTQTSSSSLSSAPIIFFFCVFSLKKKKKRKNLGKMKSKRKASRRADCKARRTFRSSQKRAVLELNRPILENNNTNI